jgi:hypothetical protein
MKPELSVVGIDLAKSIFHFVGMDKRGKIILLKRLARGEVLPIGNAHLKWAFSEATALFLRDHAAAQNTSTPWRKSMTRGKP